LASRDCVCSGIRHSEHDVRAACLPNLHLAPSLVTLVFLPPHRIVKVAEKELLSIFWNQVRVCLNIAVAHLMAPLLKCWVSAQLSQCGSGAIISASGAMVGALTHSCYVKALLDLGGSDCSLICCKAAFFRFRSSCSRDGVLWPIYAPGPGVCLASRITLSVNVFFSARHICTEGILRPCPELTRVPPMPVFFVEYSPGPGTFDERSMAHSTSDFAEACEIGTARPSEISVETWCPKG